MKSSCLTFVLILKFLLFMTSFAADPYKLSIIHINDFHARFEPTDIAGGVCAPGKKCIGGYARTVYTVKRLLNEHKNENVVYFNSGDSFQGTLWYNIGRWNVTSEFLNLLPADAMTLGNHEFDHGIEGVVPFLDALKSPMVVANIDASNEPTIQGKFNKSMIIERGNRKIGVIGVILETTYNLAKTGNLIFHNESDAILEEAAKLKASGVNIIIVLSHCGYDVDQVIARNVGSEIDVIVGAHSHTFLYTGNNLPGPDKPGGDYPTVVTHETGHKVLIVQAAAYTKYVGFIEVTFDDDGKVLNFNGAPIYMDATVPQDKEVNQALIPWKAVIDKQGDVVIGETKVDLLKDTCSVGECNLGNFYCDSMIYAFAKLPSNDQDGWTSAAIGIVNTGALRVPLFRGNLTYAELIAMAPFDNTLVSFNLRGDILLQTLEYSVEGFDIANGKRSSWIFLQVSGLKITYDLSNPVGKRVVGVDVRCAKCTVPHYEKLNKQKIYRIVAPNFLVNGGDGYAMLREYATNLQEEMTDSDALLSYTAASSPIITGIEGRINIVDNHNSNQTNSGSDQNNLSNRLNYNNVLIILSFVYIFISNFS